MMTDPQETSADVESLGHSSGDPDPIRDEQRGSDVGGPAVGSESTAEESLTTSKTSSAAPDDETDSQSKNPL